VLYFRYDNTNCFFVRNSSTQKLMAIDAGWPGTLYEYARSLKTIGCSLENVAWVVLTHFHMDHAGLVSEFMERGVTCFVLEGQIESIDAMEKTIEKNDKTYRRIDKTKLRQIRSTESKAMFEAIGIDCEAVPIDYHSPDSMIFLLPDGEVVIGDLPPEGQMMPDDKKFLEAWQKIRNLGGRKIFPSHANVFDLKDSADHA